MFGPSCIMSVSSHKLVHECACAYFPVPMYALPGQLSAHVHPKLYVLAIASLVCRTGLKELLQLCCLGLSPGQNLVRVF